MASHDKYGIQFSLSHANLQVEAMSAEKSKFREQISGFEEIIKNSGHQLRTAEQQLEDVTQQLLSADLKIKDLQREAQSFADNSDANISKQAKDVTRLRRMLEQMHERFNSQQVGVDLIPAILICCSSSTSQTQSTIICARLYNAKLPSFDVSYIIKFLKVQEKGFEVSYHRLLW